MARLDPKEHRMAMREAARMREANEDPYFLASSLLAQSFKIRQLENVASLAEQLIESNNSEELREKLAEALQIVRGGRKRAA